MNFKGRRIVVADRSDSELVHEIHAGNQEAFRSLYRKHVARVRSILVRLSGPDLLNDQTQEVFLSVWRNISQVQKTDAVAPWIYRIAVNVAYDGLRSKKKWRFVPLIEETLSSESAAYASECRQLVELVLIELDFPHRSVLILHDMEQLTEKEIAEVLSIPVGTVKSRLHTARARARKLLEEKGKLG